MSAGNKIAKSKARASQASEGTGGAIARPALETYRYTVAVKFYKIVRTYACFESLDYDEFYWFCLSDIEIEGQKKKGKIVKITADDEILMKKGLI